MHAPHDAGYGHRGDDLALLIHIASGMLHGGRRAIIGRHSLQALPVVWRTVVQKHHHTLLDLRRSSGLDGQNLGALLAVLQHHLMRRTRLLLQAELVGCRSRLYNGPQLSVDTHGQSAEEVKLLFVALGILGVASPRNIHARCTCEACQLGPLQGVVPITVHAVQSLMRLFQGSAERLEPLRPTACSQLAAMNETHRKWALALPGVGRWDPVAWSRAMLHSKAAHKQKRITLLVQVRVVEGQRRKAAHLTSF
mmetsp:Transcript_44021/g.104815  ORF Transcript_44021/g.104815 Transcript_44021/m.104815 type:complete len:252 (-) Transcript_44021:4469-5224(-)